MDNFRIDITCNNETALLKAFEIAFTQYKAATHYVVRGDPPTERADWSGHPKGRRLIFMWSDGVEDAVALPFKLDAVGACDFARRWLAEADYGKQPDHDGSNSKGWRVYNEAWGHVEDVRRAIVAVAPAWAMHGK